MAGRAQSLFGYSVDREHFGQTSMSAAITAGFNGCEDYHETIGKPKRNFAVANLMFTGVGTGVCRRSLCHSLSSYRTTLAGHALKVDRPQIRSRRVLEALSSQAPMSTETAAPARELEGVPFEVSRAWPRVGPSLFPHKELR
jgi:hypothetical protein